MVVPQSCGVHAERAIVAPPPGFPQAAGRAPGVGPQSWGISCAQTAIIPTNSVIDASAAASSTKIFNMPVSRDVNIRGTLFCFCSKSQGDALGGSKKNPELSHMIHRKDGSRERFLPAPVESPTGHLRRKQCLSFCYGAFPHCSLSQVVADAFASLAGKKA